jgi:hypothetical protein
LKKDRKQIGREDKTEFQSAKRPPMDNERLFLKENLFRKELITRFQVRILLGSAPIGDGNPKLLKP